MKATPVVISDAWLIWSEDRPISIDIDKNMALVVLDRTGRPFDGPEVEAGAYTISIQATTPEAQFPVLLISVPRWSVAKFKTMPPSLILKLFEQFDEVDDEDLPAPTHNVVGHA